MQQTIVFKTTNDDWYGSYTLADRYIGTKPNETKLVTVTFCGNISSPSEVPLYRTCVWGNDDCGLEFDSVVEALAWNKFLRVICMKDADMEPIRKLGFVSA